MTVRPHADDLGLHPAVDRAVFRAFRAGAISGASLLATGPTFREAAREARAIGLPLALHLALVDTAPLSSPHEIPSLVSSNGRFPTSYWDVLRRVLLPGLHPAELRLELGRQLQAFAEADLVGTAGLAVDGHQHLHLLPVVFESLLSLATQYLIASFRLPLRSPFERRKISLRSLAFLVAERLGRQAQARASTHAIGAIPCWGVLFAGHLTLDSAQAVLGSLPPGSDGQLLCHPGDDDRALSAERPWGYAWETELETVLALSSSPAS